MLLKYVCNVKMAYNGENYKCNLAYFRKPCDVLSTMCNNFTRHCTTFWKESKTPKSILLATGRQTFWSPSPALALGCQPTLLRAYLEDYYHLWEL